MVEVALQPTEDGSQPLVIDIMSLYIEAVGGEKKWHIYRLESYASALYHNSISSTSTSTPFAFTLSDDRIHYLV